MGTRKPQPMENFGFEGISRRKLMEELEVNNPNLNWKGSLTKN